MFFFFQAEDGIRDLVRSRGLGDVYKRQAERTVERKINPTLYSQSEFRAKLADNNHFLKRVMEQSMVMVLGKRDDLDCCLLYTSDAADERSSVDLGGRRIIKKKKRRSKGQRAHATG